MSTNTKSSLTTGSIAKQLASFTLPLLLLNLCQQLYGTIDASIVSHYVNKAAFAGVGMSGALIGILLFLLIGCYAGCSIILANFYGAGNSARFRQEVCLVVRWGTVLAILLSVTGLAVLPTALNLMQTPADVYPYTLAYTQVVLGGILAAFAYHCLACILRSIGDTKRALYYLVLSHLVNIVLDYLFVGALGWGVRGAALATIISQLLSCVLCWRALKLYYPQTIPQRSDDRFDMGLLKQTVHYSTITAIQAALVYVSNLLIQRCINAQGTDTLAAYIATMRLENLIKTIPAATAIALGIFIAQNQGAKCYERSHKSFQYGLAFMVGAGLVAGIILYAGSQQLMGIFLTNKDATPITQGAFYLESVALFYYLPFAANAFQGWFRGLGIMWVPMASTAVQLVLRVTLTAQNIATDTDGLQALARATIIGWVAMMVMRIGLYCYYRRKANDVNP